MYHYLDYIPQWKHIASDVGDVIFVKPLVECIVGADLITGEELDGYERGMKLVVAAVDVTGIGLAARAGAGLGVKGVSEVVMIGMTTDALSTVNSDVTQMFVKDMGGSDEAANLAGFAAGWATGAASDRILGNSLYNTVTNVNGINGGMADDILETGNKVKKLTIIGGGSYSTSEINAAQYMASMGNDVVLRPPIGTRAGGATSDLLVNGINYDVYTPITTNPDAIIRAITKKNTQATGIVLDLSQTTVKEEELGNILARVRGAIEKSGGICNINDVVLMPK